MKDHGGIEGLTKRKTNYPKNKDIEPNQNTLKLLSSVDAFSLELDFYNIVKREFQKQFNNAFGLDKQPQLKSRVQYNQIHNSNGKMGFDESKNFRNGIIYE